MADLSGLVHPWAPVFYGSYGAYECPHCLRSVEWPMDGLCPDLVSKRLDTLAAQAVGVQEWRRRLLTWVQRMQRIKGSSPPYIGQAVTNLSREIYAYGAHPQLSPEIPADGKSWPWVPVHWVPVKGPVTGDILDAFRVEPGVPNEDESSLAYRGVPEAIRQIKEWAQDLDMVRLQSSLYIPLAVKRIAADMREYCVKAKKLNEQEPK